MNGVYCKSLKGILGNTKIAIVQRVGKFERHALNLNVFKSESDVNMLLSVLAYFYQHHVRVICYMVGRETPCKIKSHLMSCIRLLLQLIA